MAQPHRILGISAACVLSMLLPSLSRAGTWVAFQNSYTRGTGAPVTVTSTFTLLNPNTQYTLKAFNGGLQNTSTELVSSSVVYLNGVQVIGPANFNQNVAEVNVTIFPGLTNTLSVQVRGQPGGVLTIQVIGVDNDPPIITTTPSAPPSGAGWYNSPVTVTFSCSDKTSGVASCPPPVTVSTEGANQSVTGTATDLAGNTATTSVTVNLDMTPPTITASINPPPDASGYNSGPVTVTFTCSDNLSGVASCPAPVSVTTEGANQLISGLATDVAGNVGSIGVSVNISFSYFKIQSWQTGPNGNEQSPSGKCLDYGPPQPVTGATVFLNDCSAAHAIRVFELPTYTDSNGNSCDYNDQPGKQGNCFAHEVLLFAGNSVIGIQNPGSASQGSTSGGSGTLATTQLTINPGGTPQYATEYQLELQIPVTSPAGALLSHPENQIFRLDGDSIILEGTPASNGLPALRTPCLSTVTNACPSPPGTLPLLVIQVQNAQGANGSPLVAAVRNLSDNEFWDFVATDGTSRFPTTGFISMIAPPEASASSATPITTNWQLWNAICAPPAATSTSSPTGPCVPNIGWGTAIMVRLPATIDLSSYPPIVLPAGVTLRGDRRGTLPGPQLYLNDSGTGHSGCESLVDCMLEIQGDYARVSGLRLLGQAGSGDVNSDPATAAAAIGVDSPGPVSGPLFSAATTTQYIATIDHNEGSGWGGAVVSVDGPYHLYDQASPPLPEDTCSVTIGSMQYTQTCGPGLTAPCEVPVPYTVNCTATGALPILDVAATQANVRVARNFLHHNFTGQDKNGYAVVTSWGSAASIEGNTFVWNRHSIASDGEPHDQYRATNNLVLSNSPQYCTLGFCYHNQDFDMHGTDKGYTGAGGYYVNIAGNTFLGVDRQNYWLRGFPNLNTDFSGNVSLQTESDAVHYINCASGVFGSSGTPGCSIDYTGSPFPINIYSNNRFKDSPTASTDPTAQLGVGDFDGDGDDDLFMATGAGWYFSPAGQREWRYLNSAPDTIDQLLLGDFDGDGRTDVVGMRNGQLYVSWGGISAFEPLNSTVPANCTMANMTTGDFNGVGRKTDIFCAAWQQSLNTYIWWISYGGTATFTQVNSSAIPPNDLRFGHFAICRTGVETDVFSVQSSGWNVSCGATTFWQPLGVALTQTADGLVVADFDGDGKADVGMPCSSGGVLGTSIGATPGWQIFYGRTGTQGWSTCNIYPSAFSLANGAVGRFSGGPGADILLWSYYGGKGAAVLWDFPGGAGTPFQLSAPDVDAH